MTTEGGSVLTHLGGSVANAAGERERVTSTRSVANVVKFMSGLGILGLSKVS